MRRIVISGGTGFLGKALESYFQQQGDEVLILTRKPKGATQLFWDGKSLGQWQQQLNGADILINLAGKSVDCRYSEANKKLILDSRVQSTLALHRAIGAAKNPPSLWLNASSATTYVHSETTLMTESNGLIGDDFSMNVCKQWEQAFFGPSLPQTRRAALRTSIVLGQEGGAFPKLKQITRLGLGGFQGNGQQKVSWLHIQDFCRAVDFIINQEDLKGPINLTAPNPTDNQTLMKHLRQSVGIPFGLNQPKALLELGAWLMRTETELLLKSRNVYPERLLKAGFEFEFSEVKQAIADLTS